MVRFILNLQARAHIGQTELNTLNLLSISDRVTQLRLNQVFKIRKGTSPLYLKEHFREVKAFIILVLEVLRRSTTMFLMLTVLAKLRSIITR